MKQLTKWAATALITAVTLFSQSALAEQFVVHGDYEIHYNAFNSTFVQPNIAKNIDIQRSKRRALLNVSVLKIEGDKKVPVSALVSGEASNLAGQVQKMSFKKIDEGNAIYYLGQFGFTDRQIIRITFDVQPDPNNPPFTIKFEQQFYED
jgi:hypothetical protein